MFLWGLGVELGETGEEELRTTRDPIPTSLQFPAVEIFCQLRCVRGHWHDQGGQMAMSPSGMRHLMKQILASLRK